MGNGILVKSYPAGPVAHKTSTARVTDELSHPLPWPLLSALLFFLGLLLDFLSAPLVENSARYEVGIVPD